MENPIVITGMGVVSSYGVGNDAFSKLYNENFSTIKRSSNTFNNESFLEAPVESFNVEEILGKKGLRVNDRITILLSVSLELLYKNFMKTSNGSSNVYKSEEQSILIGTSGPIQSILDFDLQAYKDPLFVQPGFFPNIVYCSTASYGAIRKSIKGGCITLINGDTSSLDAVIMGFEYLRNNSSKIIICGGVEELLNIHLKQNDNKDEKPLGEGAFVFFLETLSDAKKRNASIFGEVMEYSTLFCPDLQLGATKNLFYLKEKVGQEMLDSVKYIFTNKPNTSYFENDFTKSVKIKTIEDKIGFLGPLSGAAHLASLIVDKEILSGDISLILNQDKNGNCTSLLVKKY